MLRSNTHKLSDLIKFYKKKHQLEQGIGETRVINAWPNVVGTIIAKKTKNIEVKNRKLYISLNSSVVRNELILLKQDLIKRLNEEAGSNTINDIYFR
jgi:predicted nucleic acid-binding Zn ribbon protein